MTIGVSELQKNISIIRNLKETLYVVDRKTNEVLATILPNEKMPRESIVEQLGGIFSDSTLPPRYKNDVDAAIEDAFEEEMRVKYGK